MKDICNPKCVLCEKHPHFGYKGKRATHCGDHKLDGMINVHHAKCQFGTCEKQPTFGMPGGKASHCKDHKTPEMVDVHHLLCQHGGGGVCKTRAGFAMPGEKPKFCKAHALEGMVDVVNLFCKHEGCHKSASFAMPGDRPQFCKAHSSPGMKNVRCKRCKHPGCWTQPSYAMEGQKAIYCIEHMLEGMVDVRSPRCQHPSGCKVQPCYGYPADGKTSKSRPIRCYEHREIGKMVNVLSKKCIGCDIQPTYGYLGHSPIACKNHAVMGMLYHPIKRCCFIVDEKNNKDCHELAFYTSIKFEDPRSRKPKPESEPKFYCEAHKPTTSALIRHQCSECGYPIDLKEKKCAGCKSDRMMNWHKRSEFAVKNIFDACDDLKHLYVHNRAIVVGGSRCRPDFVFRCNGNTVIVENDEYSHRHYKRSYEKERMLKIYVDSQQKNLTFIRFNPDGYKPDHGEPWPIETRQNFLLETVRSELNLAPDTRSPGIMVYYLFYNGFSKSTMMEWINPCENA